VVAQIFSLFEKESCTQNAIFGKVSFMSESMTIQGRKLFTEDIELIRRMMADNPNWHRSRLSIENLFF
jgi:hypothetical protein